LHRIRYATETEFFDPVGECIISAQAKRFVGPSHVFPHRAQLVRRAWRF
jgi:hypothetical protein